MIWVLEAPEGHLEGVAMGYPTRNIKLYLIVSCTYLRPGLSAVAKGATGFWFILYIKCTLYVHFSLYFG